MTETIGKSSIKGSAGRIMSLNVGLPQQMTTASGHEWISAIRKEPVQGPLPLGRENLEGDGQADRRHHGGPDKAVCFYSLSGYEAVRDTLQLELPPGAFGENITLAGWDEDDLGIGDVLTVGSTVVLQITQPRQPCANVSRRWKSTRLPRWMEKTGATGFYCRVLQTGEITAGDNVTLRDQAYPDWSLRRANAVMYAENSDPDDITTLRALPLLSAEWKRILGRKLQRLT